MVARQLNLVGEFQVTESLYLEIRWMVLLRKDNGGCPLISTHIFGCTCIHTYAVTHEIKKKRKDENRTRQ